MSNETVRSEIEKRTCKNSGAASCYIAKLEEYIKFLTDTGNKTAMYLAIHGMGDSQNDIEKGARLREEIYQLKKAI